MHPRTYQPRFSRPLHLANAFVFYWLIDPMAEGLGVGGSFIGQLQMVFGGLQCWFGGPFLARLLSGVDRKSYLWSSYLASMVGR